MNVLVKISAHRLLLGLVFIFVMVFFHLLTSWLLPSIDIGTGSWHSPYLLPYIQPIGDDFREGYFYPAKVLLQGKSQYVDYNSIYPPFSTLLAVPFRLFPVGAAYLVLVVLLFVLNIACVLYLLFVAVRTYPVYAAESRFHQHVLLAGLAPLWVFMALTGYGFLFSVERGNLDILAFFFCILGLILQTRPNSGPWLPVLFFSMGTHMKIYPAILFVLVVWRFRWRSIIPILMVNLGLFFITGYQRAFQYIGVILKYSTNPFVYITNHSAFSFGTLVNGFLEPRFGIVLPTWLWLLLPCLVWFVGFVILWKRGWQPENALWLFLLSVPMMNLVPSVSHDYKLVILMPVLVALAYLFIISWDQSASWSNFIQFLVLLILGFFLTRSYTQIPYSILGNKYPFIFLLELLIFWEILDSHSHEKHLYRSRNATEFKHVVENNI